MTTADALATFRRVQADLAAIACMVFDVTADREGNYMSTTATDSQIANLRRLALNGSTREISRDGITLTHEQFDSLGDEVVDWMRNKLKLQIAEDSDAVVCTGWGVTAESITTRQLRDLHEEALAAGDSRQVDLCQIALSKHETHNEEGIEHRIGSGDRSEVWTRTEARDACADAINTARAMED